MPRVCGPEISSFIEVFGRYFQIRDDYQNLASGDVRALFRFLSFFLFFQIFWLAGRFLYAGKQYARQKGSCEDLDEGKISLPLIHSMQKSSPIERAQIKGIFGGRGSHDLLPEIKAFVFNHIDQKTASLAYIREMLKGLEVELMNDLVAVEKVTGMTNPLLRSLLAKLEL